MKPLLTNIDFLKIAGIQSILGVDLGERGAHIVELRKTGSVLNKYRAKFQIVNSFSVAFESGSTVEQRGKQIADVLKGKSIAAKHTVVGISSLGIKSVTVNIPVSSENIEEWVLENRTKLSKVPIPLKEMSFRYELLSETETDRSFEITFLRNSEIESCQRIIAVSGLELVSLGVGMREILNDFILFDPEFKRGEMDLVFSREDLFWTLKLSNGKRLERSAVPLHNGLKAIDDWANEDRQVMVTGDDVPAPPSSKIRALNALGCKPEHSLAVGLAIKGFLPECSPVSFATTGGRFLLDVYKSLTLRLSLLLGVVLILLLALPWFGQSYLQSEMDSLDEKLAENSKPFEEMQSLEREVNSLSEKISNNERLRARIPFARMLYSTASTVPDGLWLSRLTIDEQTDVASIALEGYAEQNDRLSMLLRSLQQTGLCEKVSLIKSGSPEVMPVGVTSRNISTDLLAFEVRGIIRK